MLHLRFQYDSGNQLSFSVERLSDGLFFDFSPGVMAFSASPGSLTFPLPEDAGAFRGRYKANLATNAAFADGDYVVTIHDQVRLAASETSVVAELVSTLRAGDDETFRPSQLTVVISGSVPASAVLS